LIIMLRIVKPQSLSLLKRSLATHTATGPPAIVAADPMRHDWTKEEVKRIYDAPLLDLVFRSASVHRQHHDPSKIQLCTLMNIKSE
jgi:biotin synthase